MPFHWMVKFIRDVQLRWNLWRSRCGLFDRYLNKVRVKAWHRGYEVAVKHIADHLDEIYTPGMARVFLGDRWGTIVDSRRKGGR